MKQILQCLRKKKKTPKTHPAGLPSCQGQDCRREPGSRGDTRFLPTLGAERDPPGKGLCLQEPIMKLGSGTLKHTRPRDAMRAAAALSHRNPGTGEPGPQTSLEGAGGGARSCSPLLMPWPLRMQRRRGFTADTTGTAYCLCGAAGGCSGSRVKFPGQAMEQEDTLCSGVQRWESDVLLNLSMHSTNINCLI